MAYRSFFGVCVASFMFAACGDDETVPSAATSDTGGTAGSMTGTGGRNTGGARTGGSPGTGGRASGGAGGGTSGAGGASTGGGTADGGGAGGVTTDGGDGSAGDSSTGTGGTGTGGAGTGGAAAGGAGGANTGGATTDGGGACSVLSACCSSFQGRRRTACQNIANAGNAANCAAVEDVFCGDGGTVGPPGDGGGGDAFVNCTALQTCCDALADGGRANRQCERVVTNGNDGTCNQVSALFCN
jgi:hypothetical protein